RGPLRSGDPRQPGATLRFLAAHRVAALPLRDRSEERDRAQREPLIALPPRPGPRLPASDPLGLEARRHDPLSLAAGPPALRAGAHESHVGSLMASAIVVGAGVFGCSIADRLAGDGWSVTLVDQFEPGDQRASSGGESRLLRCSHGAGEWYTD